MALKPQEEVFLVTLVEPEALAIHLPTLDRPAIAADLVQILAAKEGVAEAVKVEDLAVEEMVVEGAVINK